VILVIRKWERIILDTLLKKYEKRFHNRSSFKQRVILKFSSNDFDFYTSPTRTEDPELIEESVTLLEQNGFIEVKREKYTNIIQNTYLNLDKIDEIYRYLNKKNISNKYDTFLMIIQSFDVKVLQEYYQYLSKRSRFKQSIKSHLLTEDDITDVCIAIKEIENLKSDIFLRNLSVKLYNDSKKLESILPKIYTVYKSVVDDFSIDYLVKKGLLKNPAYIFLKGHCKIKINGEVIDLNMIGSSIGLNANIVEYIDFESVDRVTTVENLTTFNSYDSDGLVLYLGGFSNHVQNSLLNKIKLSRARLYHFGDIDYGGFMILLNIYNNIGILPTAINMDIKTLQNYNKYAKVISDRKDYLAKLKSLLNFKILENHFETIQYMINNQIILEQEAVILD